MFTVTFIATDRLDIAMCGSLNAEGMKSALDELDAKSEAITLGKMLFDVVDVYQPLPGAIGIEFSASHPCSVL